MSSTNKNNCGQNENLRYLTVNEYNKIMDARKKLVSSDVKYSGYTEKKLMKLLGINPWLENLYIRIPNKGGKKTSKSKTSKSKTSKSKKSKSKTSKSKTSKSKTIKNKKNL